MKSSFNFLLAVFIGIAFTANALPFDTPYRGFKLEIGEIHWDAPTNHLPASLWVYKVVPQEFPVKAVNRLLKMGGFTNTISDKKQGISVANSSNTCNIVVYPAQGHIRYWDAFAPANHWDKTNHLNELVQGLPDESQVEEMGLKLLRELGINEKDLAHKADGKLLLFHEEKTRGYFNRRTKSYVENELICRGIFFNRRMDGVNFAGIGVGGGCEIEYGNNAKIEQLNLVWRNLKPYQKSKIVSPNEVMQFIREGKTFLTHKNTVSPADVKSLTITEFSPLYDTALDSESPEFVYPFGKIEAVAQTATTNVEIEIYCPIISTNVVSHPRH